jgi:uncharacterized protein YcnI
VIRFVGGLLAAAALSAPGHVEPQISEARAGDRTTFSFLVEHGCDGSPTIQVSIQLPEGAFEVVPIAPAGWTGAVEATEPPVVTFTGGVLPDDVPGTFDFELVTPNRPGEFVYFPTVQTCEVGEIGWVETAEGAAEPAPRILLTDNAQPILPTTTTATTAAPTTTSTPPTTESAAPQPEDSGDDDGGTPVLPIAALAAASALVVGVVAFRRQAR